MCMAATKAKEAGMKTIICASTGNTSASAAAYAATKMDCIVLIPKGKIALGKLSQAMMHGARVIQINGNFDVALNIVREIAEKEPIALVNSVNPNQLKVKKQVLLRLLSSWAMHPIIILCQLVMLEILRLIGRGITNIWI